LQLGFGSVDSRALLFLFCTWASSLNFDGCPLLHSTFPIRVCPANNISSNLLASLAAASAFHDYGTAAGSDFSELNAPADLVARIQDNYLDGFIRVPVTENPEALEDYRYHFIFSPKGLEAVKAAREEDGKSDDWWPEPLPDSTALAGMAAVTDSRRLRRVSGFPLECVDNLLEYTKEELSRRKEERAQANDGVDPDDRYYEQKTPQKTKGSQELSRIHDSTPSVSRIKFPTGSKDFVSSAPSAEGSKDVKVKYETIQEEDANNPQMLDEALAMNAAEAKADCSDYSDFDGEPDYAQVLEKIDKHPSYRPTPEVRNCLSAEEKRKVTMKIKKKDRDYAPPPLPKVKKAKVSKKGKSHGAA
jgi:hypothetical protein